MPDSKYIEELKQLTTAITMTVAHEKYATLEKKTNIKFLCIYFRRGLLLHPIIIVSMKKKKIQLCFHLMLLKKNISNLNYTRRCCNAVKERTS